MTFLFVHVRCRLVLVYVYMMEHTSFLVCCDMTILVVIGMFMAVPGHVFLVQWCCSTFTVTTGTFEPCLIPSADTVNKSSTQLLN